MRDRPVVARLARLGSPANAAALALFVALALFGARYHWVEEVGSAERDGYVRSAETLLAGEIPRDPYRPLLYPLLVAGLARLVALLTGLQADGVLVFAVARLVSNAAAAGLARLAYHLGARLDGSGGRAASPAGFAAFALVAVNPNLWTLGQSAATDMLFAVLGAAALAAGLGYLVRPRLGAALAMGLALGAAAFVRTNALFLAPALALAWAFATGSPQRLARLRTWGEGLLAAGAATLLLAPHFVLRHRAFGDPFHDENWKNLAYKLYGGGDWSYLGRAELEHEGLGSILRADSGGVWAGALSELARFATDGLAQLLGTPLHAAVALGSVLWLMLVARGAATPAGDARAVRAGALWLAVAGASFLIAVATLFFAWGRLLLLLLPITAAWSAAGALAAGRWLGSRADGLERPDARRLGRLARRAVGLGLALLVAVLAAKTFLFRLPAFVERHPYTEVATLERLDRSAPAGAALAGTSPFLGRYLERPYLYLPDAFGDEVARPELYFARLAPALRRAGVDLLVVGRGDLRSRPAALLAQGAEDGAEDGGDGTASGPVPWLVPVGVDRQAGVAVWRVELPALPAAARWPPGRLPEGPYEWDLATLTPAAAERGG